MKSNNANNLIAVFAIAIFVIALINGIVTFVKVSEFKEEITGFASGYVNLTVNTMVFINITNDTINWGGGTVNATKTNATLTTHGNTISTVANGNWSTSATPIIIGNFGNINCSIKLQAGKNAAAFFNGSASEQAYQWNITNKDPNSCGVWAETSAKETFANVNLSAQATICNKLDFHTGSNELYLDVKLVVPYDASNTGGQADIITITGDAAI